MYFTLADLITDIAQNACESTANRVEIEINENDREFRFFVRDNGKGMTELELDKAIDPFVTDGEKHPHRKIGLGLPFFVQTVEQSGGGWDMRSEKGKGTTATAWFDTDNADTPPVGDLAEMFRTSLLFESTDEIIIYRSRNTGSKKPLNYRIRKSELEGTLGDLNDAESAVLLNLYLHSLEGEE